MTPEYIAFVQSRAKPGADILATLTAEKTHLLHMAVGISGEAAEFFESKTEVNSREEAGDLLFYITGATFALPSWSDSDWQEARSATRTDKFAGSYAHESVVLAAGDFLDLVKKYTVYNKPFEETVIKEALIEVLYQLGTYYGDELDLALDENVAKLTKRYATGYSDAAAQERADKPAGE